MQDASTRRLLATVFGFSILKVSELNYLSQAITKQTTIFCVFCAYSFFF